MSWPHPPDYNEAIQNPKFCFNDPELQRGQPAVNALGLPWPRSGNHADVYKLECPDGQTWAVKCFTREVHGLRRRYQAISDHLRQTALPAMVDFQYQDEGIRIHGQWYPIVKMRWVDGLTLNELLREHADKPLVLERLAQLWLRLAQEMRNAQIAHGDLQHGNVLLVPGATAGTLRLRLVDYDGLVVPALAKDPSGEVGHPNYQHPQRLRDGTYNAEVDRFAHLVIYTTIRCVALAGRPLWERHDNGENFLFREQDFQAPADSRLFHELNERNDLETQALVGHLLLASTGPLERVPLLDEVIVNGTVRPLTEEERQQVAYCLSGCIPIAADVPAESAAPSNDQTLSPRSAASTLILGPAKKTWRGPYAPPKGRLAFAEALYRKGNRMAKRLTGWSILAACAGLGLAMLALVMGMVFAGNLLFGSAVNNAGTNRDHRGVSVGIVQTSHQRKGAPAPRSLTVAARPARLLPVPNLTVRLGKEKGLRVRVLREGRVGAFGLELYGLPPGVTYRVLPVADNPDALQVQMRAIGAAEGTKRVELRAALGGQAIAGGSFALTIQGPQPPRPLRPADLVLQAGQTQVVRIEVEREDHEGPIDIELHGLPEGVTYTPATVPPGQKGVPIELIVKDNAPGSERQVEVWALVAGEKKAKESFRITIRPASAPPQPELPSEKVSFPTADGVQLVGSWYPATGGAESACILLLHQPGGRHHRADWQRLARLLQKNGHAVLSFDFRGHGDSTRVTPAFWTHAANRVLRIGNPAELEKPPETISYKNFTPSYYPMLVNDIMAAHAFLDGRNDRQECNASKLLVIGAEEGAALGAMWLYEEWHRFQLTSPEPLLLSQSPEGRHVAAAVWLSIRPQMGGRFCRAGEWLKVAGSGLRVPIGFIYGADDETSAKFAQQCLRDIKPARLIRHLTADKIIRGTAASGHALLEKAPATDAAVLNYVATVLQTVPRPRWSRHFASERTFYWQFPNAAPILAKAKGETVPRLAPLERLQGP